MKTTLVATWRDRMLGTRMEVDELEGHTGIQARCDGGLDQNLNSGGGEKWARLRTHMRPVQARLDD